MRLRMLTTLALLTALLGLVLSSPAGATAKPPITRVASQGHRPAPYRPGTSLLAGQIDNSNLMLLLMLMTLMQHQAVASSPPPPPGVVTNFPPSVAAGSTSTPAVGSTSTPAVGSTH